MQDFMDSPREWMGMWKVGRREAGEVEGKVTGLVCKMKRNLNKKSTV